MKIVREPPLVAFHRKPYMTFQDDHTTLRGKRHSLLVGQVRQVQSFT